MTEERLTIRFRNGRMACGGDDALSSVSLSIFILTTTALRCQCHSRAIPRTFVYRCSSIDGDRPPQQCGREEQTADSRFLASLSS